MCHHGYETFNDHVLNAGVGSYGSLQRAYWINSTITSNYPNWSSSFSGCEESKIFLRRKGAIRFLKKIIPAAMALSLLSLLSACATTDQAQPAEKDADAAPAPASGIDHAVIPEGYRHIDPDEIGNSGMTFRSVIDYAIPAITLEKLQENSSAVVTGTITDIGYVARSAIPFIFATVTVDEALKGDLASGDKISLMQHGGYITIAETVAAMNNPNDFSMVPEDEWDST